MTRHSLIGATELHINCGLIKYTTSLLMLIIDRCPINWIQTLYPNLYTTVLLTISVAGNHITINQIIN